MKYHDFDIWLNSHNPSLGGYPLRASCERQGEFPDLCSIDPDAGTIQEMRSRVLREDTSKTLLTDFGTALYSALFSAKDRQIEILFERCRGAFLGSGDEGIRIRLRIEPPKLAALPWELLYYKVENCFLAVSTKTPVVRYIEQRQVIPDLKAQLPLRMLIVAPEGSGLDARTETANLSKAIEGMEKQVITRVLDKKVTYTAIRDALRDENFHVLHFIGHGEFQNELPFLVLDDGRGGSEAIEHERFGGLFTNHGAMKLVFLNSCKGAQVSSIEPLLGMASRLVQCGVPAVIAMQYEIGDDQAVEFAREFYGMLFKGSDKGRVEIAVTHARNSLLNDFPGDRVIGTPVLFSRAIEGVLFDLVSGDRLKDIPRTPAEVHTTEAVLRTRQENMKVLQNESATTGEVAEAIRRESTELRSLKVRLYLGKAAIKASFLVAPILFSLFWLGVFERLPPGLKIESYTVWLGEKLIQKPFSEQISLISMGSETAKKLGHDLLTGNWRGDHARLVEKLSRAGAKVVAFDISFAEERERGLDEEFSRALRSAKESGTVVVAGLDDLPKPPKTSPVFANDMGKWGLLCLGQTQGSTDIVPLVVEKAGSPPVLVPSLALAAVAAYNGWSIDGLDRETKSIRVKEKGASRRIPVTEFDTLSDQPQRCTVLGAGDVVATKIIDFTPRYRMRTPQRRFTYEDILSWPVPEIAARVSGKIVVVGVEAPIERFGIRQGLGMGKSFGYELHADAINTLLSGVNVRPIGQALQFLIILGLALFGGLLWAWYPDRSRARWILLVGAAALYLGVAILAYWGDRILLSTMYPLLALFLTYAWIRRRSRKSALQADQMS